MALAAGTWLLIALPQRWKRILPALLIAVLMTLGIRGPLYQAFGIERQRTQLDETFGVPMTILANIYDQAPESLDDETVEFLEDVAPRSVYVEHNSVGDWNDIKWYAGTIYFNKPYTLLQVYGFCSRAAVKEPALAIEALGYLMQMPLWPFCDAYWRISPYIDPGARILRSGIRDSVQPAEPRAGLRQPFERRTGFRVADMESRFRADAGDDLLRAVRPAAAAQRPAASRDADCL